MPFVQSIPQTLLLPPHLVIKICCASGAAYPAGTGSVTILLSMPCLIRRPPVFTSRCCKQQGVIAGGLEVPVIGALLLAAVNRDLGAVHVQHHAVGRIEIERQQQQRGKVVLVFRGDAAFAKPELYEALE